MAVKTDRIETQLSPDEHDRIARAASIAGLSVSAFMVNVAIERADEIITEATTATVPANYFDELLVALDEPHPAPRLAKAAQRARRQRAGKVRSSRWVDDHLG